jgi:hypothetical protein
MEIRIFESFAKMISSMPSETILLGLDAECRMLRGDAESQRLPAVSDDVFSILSFRQFVQMAKAGQVVRCARPLPPDHIEFYKETIVRLVQAKELPAGAMGQFDFAFSPAV